MLLYLMMIISAYVIPYVTIKEHQRASKVSKYCVVWGVKCLFLAK